MPDLVPLPSDYTAWLAELKTRIHSAQQRASLAVNRELVLLYWQIGRDILDRQGREGWGTRVIERLAQDLRSAFPDMKGFSPRNLKYMRSFAEAWPDAEFVQQAAAQLPWFHLCTLIDKLKTPEERNWYLAKTIKHNWSRSMLVMQIETGLLARQGQALTNFPVSLPEPQSDLARESLKDPYRFDFLGLTEEAQEREIEHALVGRQVLLNVGGDEFFIDLLFYHLRLRCFVVIELKAGSFKPEHLGQLGFYLTAIDRDMKGEHDNPTIGLLLCKTKNKVVAEYALGDKTQPMGIAEYRLVESLPAALQTNLPSIEEIERALAEKTGEEES
jgi:predicted nuclease of restriction endonuclease-like (RecB) superfamily